MNSSPSLCIPTYLVPFCLQRAFKELESTYEGDESVAMQNLLSYKPTDGVAQLAGYTSISSGAILTKSEREREIAEISTEPGQ